MTETVAFLFCDLVRSTELIAELGADGYGEVLSSYRHLVGESAVAHEGEVVDREGDGIFLVFPTAAAAIRAAADAQRALTGSDWPDDAPVAVRMGVHVGEAQRHEDGFVGLDVHRAARVGSAAHGGQVVVSDAARSLARHALPEDLGLRDLGEHRLKGLEHRERLHQLMAPGLAEDFPPLRTLEGVPNNLPTQPTSFVGRGRELAEVTSFVREHHMVTLTGVGGAGKSRLALEAAAGLAPDFPDGVWLVELATVADPEAVARQVAATMGIRETDGPTTDDPIESELLEHLSVRRLLLIIDNCEHVLAEVARLCDRVLRSCPDVNLLATSREGLGIAGERIWQIPSLSLPAPDGTDVEESDSVRLFVERAQAVASDFGPTEDTLPVMGRICRRLDGIPLAIELAAARVRVLGLERLAERLDDRFRVLTGGSRTALPRQQTLAATIDWSYELLDDDERRMFARLSVFAGSFTLEAAEEVCSGDGIDELDVLDLLTSLVDKSMVVTVESADDLRYRMLETLRVYARDRLTETGHADIVRRRHRDHYLQLAVAVEDDLIGGHLAGTRELETIGVERDNLQAALDRSLDAGDREQAAHLAYVLASHWMTEGYQRRAAALLRGALENAELEPEWEAELRGRLGAALMNSGDQVAGLDEIEHAHRLVADAEPSLPKAWTLHRYAQTFAQSVDRDARDAVAPAREALEVARAVGDPPTEVRLRRGLGFVLAWVGEHEQGAAHLRGALDLAREVNDEVGTLASYGSLLVHLGLWARRGEEARRLATEALEWFEATGGREHHGRGALDLHSFLAYIFLRTGEWDRVEATLDEMSGYHLEGLMEGWLYQVRGSLRWMQGRLEDAHADHVALRELDIRRWDRHLFPVHAEIAALRGDLDEVRRLADEYLAREVDPSEEGLKIAVLRPLVHAEVDTALAATEAERDEHVRHARAALQRMRDIDERFPPPPRFQFELPPTSLAMAEAELSRATGPDPDLWRVAHDAAYHRYWQLYARWRLTEALLAVGEHAEGAAVLRDTHAVAAELGADIISRELAKLAQTSGIRLTAGSA